MIQKGGLNDILAKGSSETFRFIFAEYFSPLCIYAMRFTRDKSSAEEIVHDTLVKLWEQRDHIGNIENLAGYLYKSVQNTALNYLKREQIRKKHNDTYSDKLQRAQDYFTVTQESGLSVMLAKELEFKILEAVDSLPAQCKEIFKLSRYSGLKNQEIAEKKKVTLNTVQKQISIALEKLRNALNDYLPQIINFLLLIDLTGSAV